MDLRKGVFVAVPVLGLAGLVLVAGLRRSEPEAPPPARPRPLLAPAPRTPLMTAVPEQPPPISAPASVAAAMDESRDRGTFLNYRAAVVSKNRPLQDALRPLLLKDRARFTRVAREEADRAATPQDREMTLLALQTLEN